MTVSRLFWLAQHAYTGNKIMGRCLGIIPTKLWLSSLMRSVMIEISCLTVLYQVSSLQLGTLFLYKSERASLSTTMVFLCFFLKGCFLNLRWEVTWSEASEYSQLVTCWQEQSNSCSHTLPSCFRRLKSFFWRHQSELYCLWHTNLQFAFYLLYAKRAAASMRATLHFI